MQLRGTPSHLPFTVHHFKVQITKQDKKCKESVVRSMEGKNSLRSSRSANLGCFFFISSSFVAKIQCGSCQTWSGSRVSSLGCGLMYFCSWDLFFSGAKSRCRILLADVCFLALVLPRDERRRLRSSTYGDSRWCWLWGKAWQQEGCSSLQQHGVKFKASFHQVPSCSLLYP